ncbi:tetratricopeptide repeat protein [Nannocystis punicea]|uniref:Tetratricopeptide repeat protein n=1 Tax=Nannocystis punicea TaxID=2995304 RepID=A0ABY7H4C0_9BACT|nr:tetratricopeptide repeat protein [Nannocystis poenicansa]WAS94133.1 tetratricopeptide repeat protein [Nannocystis poenicansa]
MLPLLLALPVACDGSAPAAPPDRPSAETPAASPEAEKQYQEALELEAAGRHEEARLAVEKAIAGGSGRDAKLLAAKLAILRDDLDEATRLLEPLASDGGDALVLYNLGLVAQKRGKYNNARSNYLAALKADPNYNPARFNLAVLTWEAGVKDEAQHHARKFIDAVPGDDPFAAKLQQMMGGVAPAPASPGQR